jgi:GDP-4-dehydro-6-deoxy-D-mannose reductase
MRFLITGVTGFVGSRLARHLLAQGIEVAGTYFEEASPLPGVAAYTADLLDRVALARAVAAAAPDVIVNLAGLSHVGESWSQMPEYFRVNVLGTENVLAAAAGRRVVVASSAEVYGAVPEAEQPIGEEREVAPRTPYALTKAAAERLALAHGAVVARSFNLIGPGQSARFALPAFAAQLAAVARGEREPVLRVGNLSARRDFVHVDDGAAGYQLLAERGRAGEIYNMASGQAFSIAEALDLLREISGVEAAVEPDPERVRPVDLPLLAGDARRLRHLGWAPRRDLRQALTELWDQVSGESAHGAG